MRRIASAALAAGLLLGLGGCYLPLGIAYPTLSYTPTVTVPDEGAKDVHAFRVAIVESPRAVKPADKMRCQFTEIELDARNEVPGQVATGISYYWALYFVPGDGEQAYPNSVHSREKRIRVRLYRRGFKTIEIGPDSSSDMKLDWEEVDNHLEQEQAIDELLGVKNDSFVHLAPGHVSKQHEAFLRFAADEYLHLSSLLDQSKAEQMRARTRILKKYDQVHDRETD